MVPHFSVYHNSKCGKSQRTLELILSRVATQKLIKKLKKSFSIPEINCILGKLQMGPWEVLEHVSKIFK